MRLATLPTLIACLAAMHATTASSAAPTRPATTMYLRLPTPIDADDWREFGQYAGLSDTQMAQWDSQFSRLGIDSDFLTEGFRKTIDEKLTTIAEHSDGDGRVTSDTVHLYEEALAERLTYVARLSALYLDATLAMQELVTAEQWDRLRFGALEAERRVYFSFIVHRHGWAGRDPLQWLRLEVADLDEDAAEQYAAVIKHAAFRAATTKLNQAAARFARRSAEFNGESLRAQVAAKDVADTMDGAQRDEYRVDAMMARVAAGQEYLEDSWQFAMTIDRSMRTITALFDDETRIELERRWDQLLLPRWILEPIPDAAGRYAAILHEIETCLDPEVADDLEDLRVEAEAARVDAVRQMTRRFLRDHETALRTSMMTHEQSSAARATQTRQRHRMTSAAIRFIDQVRIAANECLDEGRIEGEPASDVRAMLLALEEEAVGLGWHLRRMNQLDGAAIESGVYTWPHSPSSRSNRG